MACSTIAALALTAGGGIANSVANSNIRGKENSLINQEMARNQQYQNQARNVFQQSLNNSAPVSADKQIGEGQQKLAGLINNAQAVPITTSLPSFDQTNQQSNQARTNMSNKEASDFGGYSNLGLQQYLNNMNTNSNLGVIGNNARGWANVLPSQLQQAQQSQGALQGLGSLLGTAGMLTGLGGFAAAPASAAGNAGFNSAFYSPYMNFANTIGGY